MKPSARSTSRTSRGAPKAKVASKTSVATEPQTTQESTVTQKVTIATELQTRTVSQDTPDVSIETHANNFDFLRYLLACMVIFFHAIQNLTWSNNNDWIFRYTGGDLDPGSLAVDGFFAISGFLITASWLRSKSAKDFAWRRLLRIYPGFIAVVLLTLLVVAPLGGARLPYFWERMTTQDYLGILWLQNADVPLPDAFKHNPLKFAMNGSLWTIRYEIVCYALVLVLGWLRVLQKGNEKGKMRGLVLAMFVLSLLWHHWAWTLPSHGLVPVYPVWIFRDFTRFPRLLCCFMAGMCLFLYRDRVRYPLWMALVALGILLALPAVWLTGLHWALPICFSYLLLAVAFSPRIRLQHWGRYGDFSYGVYLYAGPIMQLAIFYRPHQWAPFPLAVFTCLVTTGVAALSWHLIEKPALAWKNRTLPPLPAFLRYEGVFTRRK